MDRYHDFRLRYLNSCPYGIDIRMTAGVQSVERESLHECGVFRLVKIAFPH